MGSAAFAAAVPYPDKAIRISRKGKEILIYKILLLNIITATITTTTTTTIIIIIIINKNKNKTCLHSW